VLVSSFFESPTTLDREVLGLLPSLFDSGLRIAIALVPVLVFLAALIWLESFKLVPRRRVVLLLIGGALMAAAGIVVNSFLADLLGLDARSLARYAAPVVEEMLKGAIVVYLIVRNRVGFLVDAAICGFAVGAGFAAVENAYYFGQLSDSAVIVWVVRGFGTAIMHGGVTSLLAIVSQYLTERSGTARAQLFLPGLFLSVVVHSFFNHFYFSPAVSTLAVLAGLPLLFAVVFKVSEEATQSWLGVGFDTDQELLLAINEGRIADSRVGRYLSDLRRRFPAETVVDMFCLIRLHLELSIRAKGILLMRKAGFDAPLDEEFTTRLDELRYLEKSVGKTGLIALNPIFNMSSRDLWQLDVLRQQS
jgi:RsiW-degrading membrane proteinase PrsW (M82 family)